MKKTKRILAFILCMTLFIVPLPFSVNAAELVGDIIIFDENDVMIPVLTRSVNDERCNCGVNYELVNYGGSYSTKTIGTADVCCIRTYDVVRGQCPKCLALADFYNVSETITSHSFRYEIVGMHTTATCTTCGYEKHM